MKSPVREKALLFAKQVVELAQVLHSRKEYIVSKQLLRAGTSIGANLAESIDAQSEKDFLHKINIALKEARESEYWLDVLRITNLCDNTELTISHNLQEIVAMLVATKKTLVSKSKEAL